MRTAVLWAGGSMGPPPPPARSTLAGLYFLYYGTVGITLPFLPAYLKSLSLSGAQVGVLLALTPLASLVAPPLWAHLADRSGRPDRVLTALALGSFVGFAPLLLVDRFGALLAALALYALFASSVTTLVDSMTLERVARVGGSYARLRLFGSLGFVTSSALFGLAVTRVDRATVAVPLALWGAFALWTLTARARSAPAPRAHPLAGLGLLRSHPELAWLLAATCLHWIACAPYHGTFSIHARALGLSPAVVGVSAGLGVSAEVAVMFLYPRLGALLAPRHLLALAFVGSAVRWAGMAVATSAGALVALSLLHGLTFGAFYVASVGFVAARVPSALRASGQALYVSVTFGIGGLVGYLGAGAGYDWLGGHRLFGVAALLELVAAALVLRAAHAGPAAEAAPSP